MLLCIRVLFLVSLTYVAAVPLKGRRRQTASLFNPGAMLAGVGMQTGSVGVQGGSGNPAGTPVLGSNPSQPLQSGTGAQQQGVLSVGSNPAGVINSGNPGGSPLMNGGNQGYSQVGNPGGSPGVVAQASSNQQNYLGGHISRQDFTGTGYNPNNQNLLGKRFNPDVTNSELISNPNPVNVGLAFNSGSNMFVPGSASGSASQTGVAAAHSSSASGAAGFNPNTLAANQNPAAGNFNPGNAQTAGGSFNPNAGQKFIPSNSQSAGSVQSAGSFNPNAGQSFIPSGSQSAGSVQSAGNFNPNAFSAGSFDPNAIPAARQSDLGGSVRAGSANFDPSSIGTRDFPPNTQPKN